MQIPQNRKHDTKKRRALAHNTEFSFTCGYWNSIFLYVA